MIEYLAYDLIRRFGPGTGTAVCLGNQQLWSQLLTQYSCPAEMFSRLGYADYFDIDYDGKASVLHDLNDPLPPELFDRAMLLYDGGTMEHVANIGEGFRSAVNLLKVGGVIVQTNPMNCDGDAYYGIDPIFYQDFYRANGFETLCQGVYDRMNWKHWLIHKLYVLNPAFAERAKKRIVRQAPALINMVYRPSDYRIYPPGRIRFFLGAPHNFYVGIKRRIGPVMWPDQAFYPKEKKCSESS